MTAGGQIDRERDAWNRKSGLRRVYRGFYERVAQALRPGRTLELGGGSGNFKAFAPDTISSDIQSAPWLDVVADAQRLPFAEGSFQNMVMIDTLHHLPRPAAAVGEAARVLEPGGRIVLVEPAITALSRPFYTWLHREPVRMDDDPFADRPLWSGDDPYDANQAIPTLMFARRLDRFERTFPTLSLVGREWFSLFAYPLSGGFQAWSLLPNLLAGPLLKLDDGLSRGVGRWMGFRLFVVLEKRGGAKTAD